MRRRRIRLCSQTWHALAPGERRERRREGRRGGRSSRRNRHRHRRLRHRREERGGPHGGGSPPWRAHFDGVDPGGRCAWALELCPSWPDCRAAAPAQAGVRIRSGAAASSTPPPAVLKFAGGSATRRRLDLAGEAGWGGKEARQPELRPSPHLLPELRERERERQRLLDHRRFLPPPRPPPAEMRGDGGCRSRHCRFTAGVRARRSPLWSNPPLA
ncbi:unnamed protein product [Urochloa humidicola]